MESSGIDINSIKQCSKSGEGRRLLQENIGLGSKLKIRSSGTFLLNNQEIFSTIKARKKEELETIIK